MIKMVFSSLMKGETLAVEMKISPILALTTKRRLKIMRRILDLLWMVLLLIGQMVIGS